jgi:hypothetical protein
MADEKMATQEYLEGVVRHGCGATLSPSQAEGLVGEIGALKAALAAKAAEVHGLRDLLNEIGVTVASASAAARSLAKGGGVAPPAPDEIGRLKAEVERLQEEVGRAKDAATHWYHVAHEEASPPDPTVPRLCRWPLGHGSREWRYGVYIPEEDCHLIVSPCVGEVHAGKPERPGIEWLDGLGSPGGASEGREESC